MAGQGSPVAHGRCPAVFDAIPVSRFSATRGLLSPSTASNHPKGMHTFAYYIEERSPLASDGLGVMAAQLVQMRVRADGRLALGLSHQVAAVRLGQRGVVHRGGKEVPQVFQGR